LPFSREVVRLDGLRRALAIYRMVFGQSRQEDLMAYLLAQIPENERTRVVTELQIDLSPLSQKRAEHDQDGLDEADRELMEAGASGSAGLAGYRNLR
jgi:hypothetical protein